MADERLAAIYQLGLELLLQHDPVGIANAVLEVAAQTLHCENSDFFLLDQANQDLYVVSQHGKPAHSGDIRISLGSGESIPVAAAASGQVVYVPDVNEDARHIDTSYAARAVLAIPIQMDGHVLGVLYVESDQCDAFPPEDQKVLSILANQAAFALENARLLRDERRHARELKILHEVTRQVSASLNLKDTLDAVVTGVTRLIPCDLAEVSLWDAQDEMLTLQAIQCEPERAFPVGTRFPPGKGYTGWLVRNKQPLLVPDVDAFEKIQPELLPGELPFKAYVGVPLTFGDALIGTLVLVSNESEAFGSLDLQLLEAFSHHAAIAIRNADLYDKVTDRQQELAALYAVSEATNRSPALEDLLTHALDKVIEVTRADGGGIRLLDPNTNEIVLVAHRGLSERYIHEASRFPISEEIVGWVARIGEAALSNDMWADPRVSTNVRKLLKDVGHRSLAQVPLIAQDRCIGTLGITAQAPGFFNSDDLKLLNAIGQQLGAAISNAQLFEEIQHKAGKLAALNAVAAVVNQPISLQEIMDQAIAKVVEVMVADGGGVRLLDFRTGELVILAHMGVEQAKVKQVERLQADPEFMERLAIFQEAMVLKDPQSIPQLAGFAIPVDEMLTFAVAPIRMREETVGVLGVFTAGDREFTREEMDLLTAIGHQIGLAVENADLRQDALAAERLAAVGRVAASVAHDLRSPLGGILRSAEFLARPELTANTRRKLSQAIISLAQRLINTSQQILDYARKEKLPLNLNTCQISEFLEDVLAVLEVDFSDRGIEVVRAYHYRGELVIDSDKIAQVVYNIAANARDAMAGGGSFKVLTQKVGDRVELLFSDTGPGVPPELVERIFEPFFTFGKREGAGLGLAIARRIVEEHGGELRLDRGDEKGATFVVSLPAYANAGSYFEYE